MERLLERRDAEGYPRLIPLREIYSFEEFLTQERDWHSAVTRGAELLRVYRNIGEEVVVSYSERLRGTVTTRRGMGLWYCYLTFSKRKDVYHTLTLDEAIEHAQERALQECSACAREHAQLAAWLMELKELRKEHARSVT